MYVTIFVQGEEGGRDVEMSQWNETLRGMVVLKRKEENKCKKKEW
jgi:hypothetical protein